MKAKLILSLIMTSLLAACSHHPQTLDPTNLNSLESVQAEEVSSDGTANGLSSIRVKGLEETAMSLAAQGGLASTSDQLNSHLEKDKWYLESLFNFNGMLLSHGVLPPVLVEGDNSLNLADSNTIRVADRTYKIIQQARFVTTPPNWRDYLWMTYSKPEVPSKFLLPKNSEERKIWVKAVRAGWDKGVQQAYSIFQQNLARLKRDYQGMILYRKLLQQHMISAPFVSRTELGITGDGNDLRVNDQVLRITELPKLQTESNDWRAIVVKQNDE
jgi:defect-in-organelle-trafficking protein DotC